MSNSRENLKTQEIALDAQLRETWQKIHETDSVEEIAELKLERNRIEAELSRVRLELYIESQINV